MRTGLFALSALIMQIFLMDAVHAAAPACDPGAPSAEIGFATRALNTDINDVPKGLVQKYVESVCETFFPRKNSKMYQSCLREPLSDLPAHTRKGECLHYVKNILSKTFATAKLAENNATTDLGKITAAREVGPALEKIGFKNVYQKVIPPGPLPENRFEIRVYSGGRAHARTCGKKPCGHVEICFLGTCTSDYRSYPPIDIAEDTAGRDTHEHVLEGIYVIDPKQPLPLVGTK